MKRLSIILAIVIGLFAVLAAGCGSNSPSGTVKSLFKAIDNDDYSKAKSYLTSSALEEFTPGLFDLVVETMEEEGGLKQINIIEEEINDEFAEVHFEIEFKNGDTDNGTVYLIKENGKWKIPSL